MICLSKVIFIVNVEVYSLNILGGILMKTIILDDDSIALNLLKKQLEANPYLEVVGEYSNPREALNDIEDLKPDVIFTDISMPEMDGIEFAQRVEEMNEDIQIVFVTAHEGYALESYKVNTVNYMVKPISPDEMDITVNRLLKNKGKDKKLEKQNKIYCLGRFEVYGKDEKKIKKWATAKVQEIFAYFIYKEGQEVDKWELCDILWRDYPAKKAEHNLHSSIYRLKNVLKSVGIEGIIYTQGGKYGVDFSSFTCDLWEFQSFIKTNAVVNDKNITKYEKIINLYKGEFLGNRESLWTLELNERIQRDYIQGMKDIAKYYTENKSYIKVYDYLQKIISINPFDEEAHEMIMGVYFNLGDRIGLMAYYNKLNETLEKELHIEIKESTKRLYKSFLDKL